jgi:hypothetical protein
MDSMLNSRILPVRSATWWLTGVCEAQGKQSRFLLSSKSTEYMSRIESQFLVEGTLKCHSAASSQELLSPILRLNYSS